LHIDLLDPAAGCRKITALANTSLRASENAHVLTCTLRFFSRARLVLAALATFFNTLLKPTLLLLLPS
jgi:hypothetical protein